MNFTTGSTRNVILGSFQSYMTQPSTSISQNLIMGSNGSYISGRTNQSSIISSSGSEIVVGNTASQSDNNVIIGSTNSSLLGDGTNDQNMGIYGAENSEISNSPYSKIFGGNVNKIIGGNFNSINGGQNNTISGSSDSSEIIGSNGSVIRNNADYSTILGSIDTTIDGHDYTSMISTSGRTSLYSNTVHVDNIHTFKTETFNVIDAGNVGGSINVDCSLGTIFTFSLTANTTPNFINIKTGQRFIFIVENTGSFTVPTATVGGVSSTVYAEGGTLNPTNNGFTKYQAVYASGILWINEELNYQSV